MHRHGYKGPKFGRQRDQRRALMKSLADSLILRGSIETTLPKAKAVVSYTEKLITKAKKGDLHNRHQVISSLATLEAAHKLVDDLSPKLTARSSGYFRVTKTSSRRGDNAQMAKVSFVDNISGKVDSQAKPGAKVTKTTKITKKTMTPPKKAQKVALKPKAAPQTTSKITAAHSSKQTAKRTGRRGNR